MVATTDGLTNVVDHQHALGFLEAMVECGRTNCVIGYARAGSEALDAWIATIPGTDEKSSFTYTINAVKKALSE